MSGSGYHSTLTIAAKHQEIINKFNDDKKSIKELKNELEKKNKILSNYKPNYELEKDEILKKLDIEDEIKEIKSKIKHIESCKDEDNYFINTSHILYKYFDNIKSKPKLVKNKTKQNKNTIHGSVNTKSITDFFEKNKPKPIDDNNDNINNEKIQYNNNQNSEINKFINNYDNSTNIQISDNKNNESLNNIVYDSKLDEDNDATTSQTMKNFITTQHKFQRGQLLKEYMNIVDINHATFNEEYEDDLNSYNCKKCNVECNVVYTEGYVACPKCGKMDYIIIDSDKPSYKEPPIEISYFAYKKINHFNEWLAQFQAKESTEIPQEVINKITLEIKKNKKDTSELTPIKLKEILKKLKLNKYYEHRTYIINIINGLPPPVISKETEEKLRVMFKEIQGPFAKVCPKGRKNFLSYSYVLHKFAELLELDDFLMCFPLLKSREKLHLQDKIWKDICSELKWQFICSI